MIECKNMKLANAFRHIFVLFSVTLAVALFSPIGIGTANAQALTCTDNTGGETDVGSPCPGYGSPYTCQTSGQCTPDGNPSNPPPANPSNLTPMGQVLCDIIGWLIYGNLGKGLAILAVGMLGIGALLGKTSWGMALTVCVGIAVMFGAVGIVQAMGIDAAACPVAGSADAGG